MIQAKNINHVQDYHNLRFFNIPNLESRKHILSFGVKVFIGKVKVISSIVEIFQRKKKEKKKVTDDAFCPLGL